MFSRLEHLEGCLGKRRWILFPDEHLGPAVDRGQCISELVIHHREEPLTGSLELLHLREEPSTLLVMASILDGRRSLGSHEDSDVLILLGECFCVGLLSEVEIPEHTTASENRNAEKGSHLRVMRGKSAGVR